MCTRCSKNDACLWKRYTQWQKSSNQVCRMLHQSRQFQGIIHFFGVLNAISWAISETHNENQNPPFCAGGQKVPRDLYIYIQRQANRGLLRSIRNGVVHLNALRIYRFDNDDRFSTSGLWLPDIVIDKTIYMSHGHITTRDATMQLSHFATFVDLGYGYYTICTFQKCCVHFINFTCGLLSSKFKGPLVRIDFDDGGLDYQTIQ